jgi:hypothetical protein
MKLIVYILCSLLQILIVPAGYGQGPREPSSRAKCPQLVIACPFETVEQDTQLRFSALVAGQDPEAALDYTWALTGGAINEGKGTDTITVETAGLGGRRITATVAVNGLARECRSIASCAVYVAKPKETRRPDTNEARPPDTRPPDTRPPNVSRPDTRQPEIGRPDSNEARRLNTKEARRIDAYGDLAFDLEKARLAGFAADLRREPDAQGYIIVYGGRCSTETQAEERAERAKDWLVNQHRIDAGRIVTIDAGYRETLATEIYIGPIDATLPELTAPTRPPDNSGCK